MSAKREPGDLGRISKGTPVEWSYLTEYSQLFREGIIKLSWPDFVNEALAHELARYRREKRREKP